eukprot:TRINITY_DN13255_c0_g1_i2.p1 TRINITY_DN13255_c0_g1~~TRINITY_DN13255_c0_g1_i2.p1  ORF type:complete len:124 (-),score=7.39 TRINITY_DN13255_c0_g1_i2:100-447(-)
MSDWDTGLCDCLSNCEICVVSLFCCLCQVSVQNATLDRRECGLWDVLWTLFCPLCCALFVRGKIRSKYSIKGSMLVDSVVLLFCSPCAVSQQVTQMEFKRDRPAGIFISGYHSLG